MLHEALDLINTAAIIDLFASRTNHQFSTYVFFQSDPTARFIDAFSIDWSSPVVHCFQPFSLLPRVLRKLQTDKAEGIVVAPLWKKQMFRPMLTSMLTMTPVLLSHRDSLLTLPSDKIQKYPLRNRLDILVCRVSGDGSKHLDFLETLPALSCRHGDLTSKQNVTVHEKTRYTLIF